MKASSALDSRAVALAVAAVLIGGGWFWRQARQDSSVPFLSDEGPAEWIVYPKPPDTTPHRAMHCWAVFKRSFNLAKTPSKATLTVRAFREGTMTINGQSVEGLPAQRQGLEAGPRAGRGKIPTGRG